MHAGSDIRKYRRALKLSQREFADKIDLSQATLSLAESGKINVSETVEERLRKEFNKAKYEPRYDDFCRRVDSERQGAQTLVGNPSVNYSTLPVWAWEDGFDLGAAPSTMESRGVVTVRVPSEDAIAFEMPKGSVAWTAGEILVFRRSSLEECHSGDLCLMQVRFPRARVPKTMIAIARRDAGSRRRSFNFEPCDPSEPSFTPETEQIEGFLRCVYRARYIA